MKREYIFSFTFIIASVVSIAAMSPVALASSVLDRAADNGTSVTDGNIGSGGTNGDGAATFTTGVTADQAATGQQAGGQSGFVPLAPIPGLTDPKTAGSVTNSDNLAVFFNNLYKYLIGLAAIFAVIEIIWGGLEISTKDSVSKQGLGRERITQAIFGLILVLSPVLVFSIINPSILNLSLNLPKLDLTAPPYASSGSNFGTGDTAAATAAGCSAALSNGTVGCPTQEAAQAFITSCSNGSGTVFSSDDSSLPYSASCNTQQPSQNTGRNYNDVSQIPSGNWCYTVKTITGGTLSYTYVCQVDQKSCTTLALAPGQDIIGSGGCLKYPQTQ